MQWKTYRSDRFMIILGLTNSALTWKQENNVVNTMMRFFGIKVLAVISSGVDGVLVVVSRHPQQ